jgi:hypothetical protein
MSDEGLFKRINKLPNSISSHIFEYDNTFRDAYKKVMYEISMFPIWNVSYMNDNTSAHKIYYNKKIASDMLCHWNNHYTTYVDSLLNYSNDNSNDDIRGLDNYLDNNNLSSRIPGRKQTLFQWIEYYNLVTSR